MNANGTFLSIDGKRFSEIGRLLVEVSSMKDGAGLKVELTECEERVFETFLGMRIGAALMEVIADAVRAAGGCPKLEYCYCERVFTTKTVA